MKAKLTTESRGEEKAKDQGDKYDDERGGGNAG